MAAMVSAHRQRGSAMAESGDGSERPSTAPWAVHRLLVVEDNPLITGMYRDALLRLAGGKARLEIEVAHDGQEALTRLLRSPRVSLVIADLYMPVMDGFTLVERIRHDQALQATPVLAISAGGSEARSRAVELGVDVYLHKPVTMATLLDTVAGMLKLPAP